LYRADGALLFEQGTQALQVALELAATITGGPPTVALPAYTCFDVATAAAGAGARIVLYDVDPSTLAPDLTTLEWALAAGARTVVVAPLYGIPVPWDEIEVCVRRYGAFLIEDAAQGHGAEWRHLPLGGCGPLAVLSFGRGKGWTGGRGGALLAQPDVAEQLGRVRQGSSSPFAELHVLAAAVAQWTLGKPDWYSLPAAVPWLHLGRTRYRAPVQPRPLTRAAAGLLEHTLASASRESKTRRANAAAWLEALDPARATPIRVPPDSKPGYLRFPVRLRGGLAGLSGAGRALRLGAAPGYPLTLARLTAVRERLQLPHGASHWPGAEELVQQLVTLPTHSLVTNAEREELAALINCS
jgi:dTDP-4-amino-4,6-dideoxygalactose transaminase